jgi:hypothetical protein
MSDGGNMVSAAGTRPQAAAAWRRTAALVLVVAAVGLPLNHVAAYAVVLLAALVIFTAEVSARPAAWVAVAAVVIVSIAAQWLVAPSRIQESHNVFLPQAGGALQAGLPPDVYAAMSTEFDAQYPPQSRCHSSGCWTKDGFPDRVSAFSADGIFPRAATSRSVAGIDFSDPIWLRFGFTNEHRYNWTEGELQRNHRDGRFWMGLHRWHLLMPWFVVYRFPADFAGSTLCWRGSVLWEGDGGRFDNVSSAAETCRRIESSDAGRQIIGLAIKPDTLAMRLERTWGLRLRSLAQGAVLLLGVLVVIGGIVRVSPRRLVVPLILIGLALLVITVDDASFIGGLRPFDGGDDGLFYDGVGRGILKHLLAGDFRAALEGGEAVFYYGGPGLRYFRAIEHLIFGETYLGYLSLVLMLVFAVLALFRRFLPERWALTLVLLFVAVPVGTLFGTSFVHYEQWASRGFADPAAYILFLCGVVPVVGSTAAGPGRGFGPAFFGALLVALGIFMKPIVAPAAAVLMGGAGLTALYQRQWLRLVGLCVGFSFVLVMGVHNWVFGHALVPFSANAAHPLVYVMPPEAYAAAFREVAALNFGGEHVWRAVEQVGHWLAGPSELKVMIPLHAAAVAALIFAALWGRSFDPWLRLIAGAALAQHVVALFYVATARYHFLTWFLTMLVCAAWLHGVGVAWLQRRFPQACARVAQLPTSVRLAAGLTWLQRMSA